MYQHIWRSHVHEHQGSVEAVPAEYISACISTNAAVLQKPSIAYLLVHKAHAITMQELNGVSDTASHVQGVRMHADTAQDPAGCQG